MKTILNYLAIAICALFIVSCSKSDPDEPTFDPTSIDAFNALIFEDYHSVVDTVADLSTLRVLFEAQAVFSDYLDEINGEPKMDSFYCVVELHYEKQLPRIRSYKITHDLLADERTVEEHFEGWMEDSAMQLVPAISLKDAWLRLNAAGKLPHTKVVTLREDISWKLGDLFHHPQYIFGQGIVFVDSLSGLITE